MAFTIPAHDQHPVKSIALLNMPDGPKLLSGSTDSNVKVWNLANEKPTDGVVSIPTTGGVEHIEVSGTTIMWSVDEPIAPELPENTVGMVYLLNSADMSTIAIKVPDPTSTCCNILLFHTFAHCSCFKFSAVLHILLH